MHSVKQLSKEVSKLDAFKRNVMRTLNDESVETVDHARDFAYSPAPSGARPNGSHLPMPPADVACRASERCEGVSAAGAHGSRAR